MQYIDATFGLLGLVANDDHSDEEVVGASIGLIRYES